MTTTTSKASLNLHQGTQDWPATHHHVVVVGGGTGGISVASRLCKGWFKQPDVAIIEPSDKHYYQPLWTLVGAGATRREQTERNESSVIPRKATWIHDAVETFEPEHNYLITRGGQKISYDFLVVAAGIQINWDGIPGLKESIGTNGVCSNYAFRYVNYTWESLQNFQGGTALFTHPAGAVKCGGAPQKICYLADDHFRRRGIRDRCKMIFAIAKPTIFDVKRYADTLDKVIERKQIETRFNHNLIELRPDKKEAVFEQLDSGEHVVIKYDMIHVTPPMSAPSFIAKSPLADLAGWVDVDKNTLRHNRFDYDKNPMETFPFDQSKERWSMYMLKKYGLPLLYWQGMLKGRA